jgi:hypothetical protein
VTLSGSVTAQALVAAAVRLVSRAAGVVTGDRDRSLRAVVGADLGGGAVERVREGRV